MKTCKEMKKKGKNSIFTLAKERREKRIFLIREDNRRRVRILNLKKIRQKDGKGRTYDREGEGKNI